MSEQWHVGDRVWAGYAAGALDPIAEASVDAHVARCAQCRERARDHVEAAALEQVWESVNVDVRRHQLPWTLRWLRRLGVPEDDLVLLAAADDFALPWAVAVGAALVTVLIAAMAPVRVETSFLLFGPLIPAVAVAAAFDATDPIRVLTASVPYSQLRLALLRTTATLAVAVPATTVIGLGLPGLEQLAFGWLLPSLFLTVSTLVLLTWWPAWTSTGTVAAAWVTVVALATWGGRLDTLTGPAVQLALLAAATGLAAAFVRRTTSFRLLGGHG
jgi:hypothetical protein